jgi:hypothetical protein
VVRNNPGRSAQEVLYRPDVLRAIDEALATAHRELAELIGAGYQASMRLARTGVRAEIASWGYPPPDVELWPSRYLDAVLGDLDRAADRAKTALLHLAGEAYRGVVPPLSYREVPGGVPNVPAALGQLRALAVSAAITRALDGLARSGQAGAVVLVTRAQTEIFQAGYQQFAQQHPTLRVGKQWQTTSVKPCATCRWLNGTVVGLDQQFSHQSIGSTPPVYRDLFGPPRHPNCSCRTRLVVMSVSNATPIAV